MKSHEFLIVLAATWILSSLTSCVGGEVPVQTPGITSFLEQEPDITLTPEDGNNGEEINQQTQMTPVGKPPTIDGTISPGEWTEAALETFADGSQLLMIQTGDYLYLGIKAIAPEMIGGNVFIYTGDDITIMHTSAALGTAIYHHGEDSWQQVQDFTWRCRSTSHSEAALAERAEFLQEEGWLAANSRMGTPNELEYQIKTPEQDFRLAVVFIRSTSPYEKVPWPADLDDDCTKPTPSGLPPALNFSPDQWGTLNLINSGEVNPTDQTP